MYALPKRFLSVYFMSMQSVKKIFKKGVSKVPLPWYNKDRKKERGEKMALWEMGLLIGAFIALSLKELKKLENDEKERWQRRYERVKK